MKTKSVKSDSDFYTDVDIVQLLGITLGRLRNKLSAGSPLPPRIEPPGCHRRLWRRDAVHAWLEQFSVTSTDGARRQRVLRRCGRPTSNEVRVHR